MQNKDSTDLFEKNLLVTLTIQPVRNFPESKNLTNLSTTTQLAQQGFL